MVLESWSGQRELSCDQSGGFPVLSELSSIAALWMMRLRGSELSRTTGGESIIVKYYFNRLSQLSGHFVACTARPRDLHLVPRPKIKYN